MPNKLVFSKKNSLILIMIMGLFTFSLWQLKIHKRNFDLYKENKKLLSEFRDKNYRENLKISIKEGDYIPDFVIKTIDNKYFESKKFNNPVFLLFFNTDCKSCFQSALEIYRNLNYLEKEGLLIIGLATENENILSGLSEKNDIKFPIAQDSNSKFHKMFGIRGEPSFVLISRGKKVVRLGDFLNYREKLENLPEIIESLLNY